MKPLRELERESGIEIYGLGLDREKWVAALKRYRELIVQECADSVRTHYDHPSAEAIAWNMEIEYGLHGDY